MCDHSRFGVVDPLSARYRLLRIALVLGLILTSSCDIFNPDKEQTSFYIETPEDGATITLDADSLKTAITIIANVPEGQGIASVACYVDTVLLGEKSAPPYTWIWVATTGDEGEHTIRVVARDASGNEKETAIHVTIIVPPLSIQTPADGAEIPLDVFTLQKNITIEADSAGVANASCYVDSVLLGEKDSPPYSWTWVATVENLGSHTITVIARDDSGNERETAIHITIFVPLFFIQTPEDGAEIPLESVTLQKNITIGADITGNAGVASVLCYVDSVLLGENNSPPYTWTWVATMEDTGSHTITVIARDDSGNERETAIQINIIVPKYALQFDGVDVDDYVGIPPDAFNSLATGSVEFWIFANVLGRDILYKETFIAETISCLRINSDGTVEGSHNNFLGSDDVVSYTTITTNKWYHIVWTWDGINQKIYINGALDNTQPSTDGVADDLGWWVRFGRGDTFFSGILDEVRIWNIARTPAGIQADMYREISGTEPGLVGYWRFNEGSGTTAFDQTSNNNNGTLHGGVNWVISTAPINP